MSDDTERLQARVAELEECWAADVKLRHETYDRAIAAEMREERLREALERIAAEPHRNSVLADMARAALSSDKPQGRGPPSERAGT